MDREMRVPKGPRGGVRSGLRRISTYAGAAALALALGGCAVSRGDLGDELAQTTLSGITPGQTTRTQVITLLGAPASVQQVGDQTVFHYYHYALKHATFLVFSRVNIASDDAYIFFDRDGVVRQAFAGNRTKALKFQFWPFGA
jgi:outer membrane protein assembly factor BamE (lipoprotein component of BamABCDE complex)